MGTDVHDGLAAPAPLASRAKSWGGSTRVCGRTRLQADGMQRAPVDGHRDTGPDQPHRMGRAQRVEVVGRLGARAPAPHRDEGQLDAPVERRHALEQRRVTREVDRSRPRYEVAHHSSVGPMGGPNPRWSARVASMARPATRISSPGTTSITSRKPRARSRAAMPRGTTMGTSVPSSRSEP